MKLIYVLHSGQMFGTERMALTTLRALHRQARAVVLAPPGPVHAEAQVDGLRTWVLTGARSLAAALWHELRETPSAAVLTTGVVQSLIVAAVRKVLGQRGPHLHVVHGGTDERLSYGRKRWLNPLPVTFVAVSEFVRERLVAHGVPAARIEVVHNFLQSEPPAQRRPFDRDGVRRVILLSRLDRIKRVGLLFDALEKVPGLDVLQFDVYGSGELQSELAERARAHANVRLHGFRTDAVMALSEADLLLHTCPEEPFGLVLLEAFAAGVPVLVPNAGGAAVIVQDGVNGFHFTANNAVALGQTLRTMKTMPTAQLQAMADGGRHALAERFTLKRQASLYAKLVGVPA